ncbi:hypothetical protein O181_039854 [Austropuccinia psidii MF-1]|uniref:C2H2-type domain-containing protein n=1 Tax=Austropuccinia psidii MF-1 TaxID=1389203 RepID=A0A9Q3HEY1_9BASI|nr:hypothetical protein [Austropuccinia psidii MF-1]
MFLFVSRVPILVGDHPAYESFDFHIMLFAARNLTCARNAHLRGRLALPFRLSLSFSVDALADRVWLSRRATKEAFQMKARQNCCGGKDVKINAIGFSNQVEKSLACHSIHIDQDRLRAAKQAHELYSENASARLNIVTETPVIGQSKRVPLHFATTCPSLYKLESGGEAQSSVSLLREFFSRPDDERRGNCERAFDSAYKPLTRLSTLSKAQHGFSEPVPHYSSSSDGANHHIAPLTQRSHFQTRWQPTRRYSEASSIPQSSTGQGSENSSEIVPQLFKSSLNHLHLKEEEFRCKHCNRRCKSRTSFEKHKNSCTHRSGPLTLECQFCKRPYTYIGYLHKHEAECQRLRFMQGPPCFSSQS